MNIRPSITDRVEWHEGMLLAPQHFQLFSARVDDLAASHALAVAPFGWGVRRMRTDAGLLPAGLVRILDLDATFPDGTLVSYTAENPMHGALDLSLAPYAEGLADAPLDVYLVLPVSRRIAADTSASRFRSVSMSPVEDEVSQAVPADVPRLLPNLALAVGEVPSSLFTYLRLGTVAKDNEVIKWTATMPPWMEVPADCELWERVTAFAGQLRGKAAFVAKQTAVPSSKTEDRLSYLEQRERLRNLVSVLPYFEAIVRTPHLHPYSLYVALCGLLGPLSMLRPGSLPITPPRYEHTNLQTTFSPLLDALEDSLQEVNQEYREYKFEYRHGAFEIVILPEWLDKELVLGMRGQPERDLVAWMAGAIVGSQSAYASLRERRVLGAARSHIESAKSLGVRSSSGYTLFSIQVDEALIIAQQPLVVSNSTESATAQRPHEMVLFVKG